MSLLPLGPAVLSSNIHKPERLNLGFAISTTKRTKLTKNRLNRYNSDFDISIFPHLCFYCGSILYDSRYAVENSAVISAV